MSCCLCANFLYKYNIEGPLTKKLAAQDEELYRGGACSFQGRIYCLLVAGVAGVITVVVPIIAAFFICRGKNPRLTYMWHQSKICAVITGICTIALSPLVALILIIKAVAGAIIHPSILYGPHDIVLDGASADGDAHFLLPSTV